MSVRRIMGIETEFGITSTQRDPRGELVTPMVLSGQVVQAYAAGAPTGAALDSGAGWDYADESPLRDARGYEMARALADISQLTDVEDPTIANTVLSNGARFYVDHAHPEYSSPEVTSPRELIRYDRAGEQVALSAIRTLAERGIDVRLYKNNVDGKGASYGTHENYLVPRSIPFGLLADRLIPFLVARPVIAGSGRVGLGQESQYPGFQISARADYLEAEIGLETTLRRPIVNTRDEPHATPHVHRRLHVIVGDATMADVTTLLATGSLSAVLRLIESHPEWVPQVALRSPVAAAHAVSHDPSLRTAVETVDGRMVTGLDLLEMYLEAVERAAASVHESWPGDADTYEILTRWRTVLDSLRGDPMECSAQVEWVAKYALLQRYRERSGVPWDDPRIQAMDIQWHDLDPDRGLAQKLRAAGHLEGLVSAADITQAVTDPPADTRAWFRGEVVRRYGTGVRGASWDSVVLRDERGRLRRVRTPEPDGATRAEVAALLDRHGDPISLLAELASEDV